MVKADRMRHCFADEKVSISIIIPAFNEGANIDALLARLFPILSELSSTWEIIFVDDGSSDDTLSRISYFHQINDQVKAVSLSRNFGKEIGIAAGLDHAHGAAVIIMDADLQHPPELIPTLIERWKNGFSIVYGQRMDRSTDSFFRRSSTKLFYRIFAMFGETPLPQNAGDFRLLDRKAVEALKKMGERARFSKGLYAWIGFKSVGVPFEVAERRSGQSKFRPNVLFRFALDGIISFSTVPLRLWTYIGAFISGIALLVAFYSIISTLILGIDVPGFATLIVSITFFSGIQLLSLGIIGEYIGRIFAEVKGRPLYIVEEKIGLTESFSVEDNQLSNVRRSRSGRRQQA